MSIDLEVHECEIIHELLNKASFQGNIIEVVVALKRKIEGALSSNRSTETPRPTLVQPERMPLES